MSKGHVKLDGRPYMLLGDVPGIARDLANQMSAKIGEGGAKYDDLEGWEAWAMDTWEAGTNLFEAQANGFRYADADTKYPKQILPLHWLEMEGKGVWKDNQKYYYDHKTTVGFGQTELKISGSFLTNALGPSLTDVWVYLRNEGQVVKVSLYSSSAGLPNASLTSTTITTTTTPGDEWYRVSLAQSLSSAATYHIVLEPNVATEVITVPASDTQLSKYYYNGSSWVAGGGFQFFLNMDVNNVGTAPTANTQIFEFETEIYATRENNSFVKRNDSAPYDGWEQVSLTGVAIAGTLLDTAIFDDKFYLAEGSAAAQHVTAAGVVANVTGLSNANLFATWAGYLWAAYANNVYYSSDGATWTGPIQVCAANYEVRGLAGMGPDMYASCDDGLVFVGNGDVVVGVTPWAGPSSTAGRGMVNWQGSLYIPLGKGIYRYDGDGLLPIGLDLKEGLPLDKNGETRILIGTNNWLIAVINAADTADRDTVWAYNGQGWHSVCKVPRGLTIISALYRRVNQKIYLGTNKGYVFSVYVPDGATDSDVPDATLRNYYEPTSWIETPDFNSGLKEVYKDIESVYVSAEGIATNTRIDVYWMDDESSVASRWLKLGAITRTKDELRFSNYTTRPNTRAIRIGLLIHVDSPTVAPQRIRAVRLKYQNMIIDRFRWQLPIAVSDNQQMLDGEINLQQADDMLDHLDTLSTQVPPWIFEDEIGRQYEVKVTGASSRPIRYQYNVASGLLEVHYAYSMTIEQVTSGEYVQA